jgi:LPS-assembly protein
MPSVGYSSDEGLYFQQPIYIAPQSWWDLEFRPQVRTNRGYGIYQTFRFIESKKAKGEFRAGYFKENSKYFQESQLVNKEHYGFNFKYENGDFLHEWFGFHVDGQSEIYADISYMNDVDYINLSTNDTMNTSTATQLLSRVNTFYNGENQYIGAYFKYYQDLTKESNSLTLQKLPTLQYHYYLDTFLDDVILYNLDVQSNNITRQEGTSAVQTDINLPITLQTNLFDEYLNISYQANLYAQHSMFSHQIATLEDDRLRNGYVLRNYHTLSASTQLTKAYDEFSHVVSLGVSYNKAGTESKNGYYKDNYEFCADNLNKDDPRCEFYNITSVNEEAQIDFTQYIYDEHANEILYHRLAQRISYGDAQTKYGELENELDYKITRYIAYYNNMLYNYDKNKLSKIFNQMKIKTKSIDITVSHLYKDSFIPETPTTPEYTSYLTSSVTYRYDSHYSFNGVYNYDTITHEAKNKEIGFLYKKRCWDFGLRYSENRRPILSTSGDSYVDDKYIYLTLVLRPLMRSRNSSLISYKLSQGD